MVSLIQHFVADFLWKVSLKILNSGIILKTFSHVKSIFLLSLPSGDSKETVSMKGSGSTRPEVKSAPESTRPWVKSA